MYISYLKKNEAHCQDLLLRKPHAIEEASVSQQSQFLTVTAEWEDSQVRPSDLFK